MIRGWISPHRLGIWMMNIGDLVQSCLLIAVGHSQPTHVLVAIWNSVPCFSLVCCTKVNTLHIKRREQSFDDG